MSDADLVTAERPGRRKESWSLATIVENVAGRPITEFQDPSRPPHPYLRVKHGPPLPSGPSRDYAGLRPPIGGALEGAGEPDPVDRVYPPLSGATGRSLHGPEHEHHQTTLGALRSEAEPPSPGIRPHAPGPSRRPERVYLHYLLLHIDRLSDHALSYLKHHVDEELEHRRPTSSPDTDSTAPPAA